MLSILNVAATPLQGVTATNSKHTTNMKEATKPVPRAPKEIKLTDLNLSSFWLKVDKSGPTMPHMDSPCWSWVAAKTRGGYGHFGVARKLFLAHRVAWTIANGPIPAGLLVCHRCDNPSCVNHSHLFLGTNLDNCQDKESKGRGNPARGDANGSHTKPERRPRGEVHGKSKLNDAKVIQIRADYAAGGVTVRRLGLQFGVHYSAIGRIIRREMWQHV